MASLAQWGITAGAKGLLKDAEKDGKVAELVKMVGDFIQSFFPDDPKGIKRMFVKYVVVPFVKLLLKDDLDGYNDAKSTM